MCCFQQVGAGPLVQSVLAAQGAPIEPLATPKSMPRRSNVSLPPSTLLVPFDGMLQAPSRHRKASVVRGALVVMASSYCWVWQSPVEPMATPARTELAQPSAVLVHVLPAGMAVVGT